MASLFGNCTIPYVALTALDDGLRNDIHHSLILISTVLGIVGTTFLKEVYGFYTTCKVGRTRKPAAPTAPAPFVGVTLEEGKGASAPKMP
jgi:hypothetical protein